MPTRGRVGVLLCRAKLRRLGWIGVNEVLCGGLLWVDKGGRNAVSTEAGGNL